MTVACLHNRYAIMPLNRRTVQQFKVAHTHRIVLHKLRAGDDLFAYGTCSVRRDGQTLEWLSCVYVRLELVLCYSAICLRLRMAEEYCGIRGISPFLRSFELECRGCFFVRFAVLVYVN